MMDIQDKVAVVTGGAQGLGKSFVEILLKNGSKVAIIDVNESLGNELKITLEKEYGPDRVEFYTADVSSNKEFAGAFQKIVEKFGSIHIVCNNAGILNENEWGNAVAINLGGVVRGTYLALEHMKEHCVNEGVIVNISSIAGLEPLPAAPVNTAANHGVVGFTRAIAAAIKLFNSGVRINVLCPGLVNTNLVSTSTSEDNFGRFSKLKLKTEGAMEKYACLETDITKAFLDLVTDESKNGEALVIQSEGTKYIPLPQRIKAMLTSAANKE
ncbi:15-hydroxyprostaglandin dehydrogenase [NAD(+)]-like [Xyrauchen texanus]|uniref:15-hydroxyprostaglandin dehydrogenase [NAD(+)]-like n=1 Tax=Xyrauchen texanus TaxID=154827 RepID=UPI002241B93C|nr:15-hydroxyprostaglandin dehydrogenase [NAD(+)]-like [Xyrauchen texanus]XP_051956071.1 15-hydroxyprostaglandin dehydrogenase [NAD(+)]-like [Xyrauchen texanus]XP_051956072.1 15-hydroxyprostaglandin dehydrogenase [NAD(+)]-like [Xyrauchen texanus]